MGHRNTKRGLFAVRMCDVTPFKRIAGRPKRVHDDTPALDKLIFNNVLWNRWKRCRDSILFRRYTRLKQGADHHNKCDSAHPTQRVHIVYGMRIDRKMIQVRPLPSTSSCTAAYQMHFYTLKTRTLVAPQQIIGRHIE